MPARTPRPRQPSCGADVVFVGSRRVSDPLYPWNVDCIARLNDVRLIASAPWLNTMAAAFAVVHPR